MTPDKRPKVTLDARMLFLMNKHPGALSKSRFLTGSQCHRLLWWQAHEPEAPELVPDLATEVIFEQGHLVGEEARRRFPGGVLVDLPHGDIDGRVAMTRALVDEGVHVIYEASFKADGIFVAVDVLLKNGDAWDLVEVKCTTRAKPEHMLDVAVQRHVLERAGLRVGRVLLMHLNRGCVFPDLSSLFELVDLTEASAALLPGVVKDARAMLAMLRGPLPIVDTGDHCTSPRECPFFARCHSDSSEERESHIRAVAARQRRARESGRIVVEPGLAAALACFTAPVAFLDLETVAFAIPRYVGTRPWDPVPVQASVHLRRETFGPVVHRAHLAHHDEEDPRRSLARFLVDTLRGTDTIFAWNAPFERRCLQQMADAFPEDRASLLDLAARLVDLLPVVRGHVYHPRFEGSFSLKKVAPALVDGFSWADAGVAGGHDAASLLFRLFVDNGMDPAERAHLRAQLLDYCALDTLALVGVESKLRALASQRGVRSLHPSTAPSTGGGIRRASRGARRASRAPPRCRRR